MKPSAVLEADPKGERFFWFSWHFSGYDSKKHDAGISHYIPVNPGRNSCLLSPLQRSGGRCSAADLPDDENGLFNFSVTNLWHRTIVETARLVIVEVALSS